MRITLAKVNETVDKVLSLVLGLKDDSQELKHDMRVVKTDIRNCIDQTQAK
jgi:hypothetical protein